MNLTTNQIVECQTLLGSSKRDVEQSLQGVKTQEEVDQRIEAMKAQVRKNLRIHSKELHPDVTDDPEKIALFKRLVLVADDFSNLKVQLRRNPPPPPRPVVRIVVTTVSWSTATNSSTYYTGGWRQY